VKHTNSHASSTAGWSIRIAGDPMILRYTSGGAPAAIAACGFNMADVGYVSGLNALPVGMLGLVYLGEKSGATSTFKAKVDPFKGNAKLFGFFLCDEPDPRQITAATLKAESDYIHSTIPGAKTFITMNDMGSSRAPNFMNTFNPGNTGIDLFGISAYPCRTEVAFDVSMIDRRVKAAVDAGIPVEKIVPVFQAFGGGNWTNDGGGKFLLPTPDQMNQMFARWASLVPNPVFEYTYAWGEQNGDVALGSTSAASLRAAYLAHNTAQPAPVPAPTPVPTSTPIMLNGKVATQADVDALVAAAAKSAGTIQKIKDALAAA
jgi:hypothetical protein